MPMSNADRITRIKREVREDVFFGVQPKSVRSFSELHDYVDANGYGGYFDEDFDHGDQSQVDDLNAVQDAVDLWLREGGHLLASEPAQMTDRELLVRVMECDRDRSYGERDQEQVEAEARPLEDECLRRFGPDSLELSAQLFTGTHATAEEIIDTARDQTAFLIRIMTGQWPVGTPYYDRESLTRTLNSVIPDRADMVGVRVKGDTAHEYRIVNVYRDNGDGYAVIEVERIAK